MEKWPLPTGWEWRTIRSVVSPTERRDPSLNPDLSFVYVDIGSIDSGSGTIRDPKTLSGRDAPSRARKVIRRDDVVLATTRPYLRNIALVPQEYDDQICSTGFCVLRALPNLMEPRYLFSVCRSEIVIDQLAPNMRGANYPAVTDNDVLESALPVPPIDTQRRIVARLDALLAEVAEARRLHAEITADTGRVMEAAVSQALDDGIRSNWKWTTVGDLMVGKPRYGTSQKPNSDRCGVPVLRMGNIQDGQLDLTDLKYVDLPLSEVEKYRLRRNDLVFNRTNSAELVGKTAVFESDQPAVCASYLIRFRVDLERVAPRFVSFYINSSSGRKYIETQLVRAIGQVNVNARKLSSMPIPIPSSLHEQKDVVEKLLCVKTAVREMSTAQSENSTVLNELEQAILSQALRGES